MQNAKTQQLNLLEVLLDLEGPQVGSSSFTSHLAARNLQQRKASDNLITSYNLHGKQLSFKTLGFKLPQWTRQKTPCEVEASHFPGIFVFSDLYCR